MTKINGKACCAGAGARATHPASNNPARRVMWKIFLMRYCVVVGVFVAVGVAVGRDVGVAVAVGGSVGVLVAGSVVDVGVAVGVSVGKLGTVVTPGVGVRLGIFGTQSLCPV